MKDEKTSIVVVAEATLADKIKREVSQHDVVEIISKPEGRNHLINRV